MRVSNIPGRAIPEVPKAQYPTREEPSLRVAGKTFLCSQHRVRKILVLCIAAIFLILQSCASTPSSVPADWAEKIFFRSAQDAVEMEQYETANYYYDVFILRYPENAPLVLAAKYEKAFILYKQGKYNEAEEAFKLILEEYENNPNRVTYAPRFRQLAEIGLENIIWKRTVDKKFFWRSAWTKWANEKGENLNDPSAFPG